MYFQRRTLGDKKINQSKNRFLPAIERLESRDTPSSTPFISQITRDIPLSQNTNSSEIKFRAVFSEEMNPSTINTTNTFLAIVTNLDGTNTSFASVQNVSLLSNTNQTTYEVQIGNLPDNGTLNLTLNPNNQAYDIQGDKASQTGHIPSPNETYGLLPKPSPLIVQASQILSPKPADSKSPTATFQFIFSKEIEPNSISTSDFQFVSENLGPKNAVSGNIVSAQLNSLNSNAIDITVNKLVGIGEFHLEIPPTASILDTEGQSLATTYSSPPYTVDRVGNSSSPITFSLSTFGSLPVIEIRYSNTESKELQPFDSGFKGGVRTAIGDYNGDGFDDIIATAAEGAQGHVVVFDGISLNVIASFYAYPGYNGSVNIAAGDLAGSGQDDLIIGVAGPGPSHVSAFRYDEASYLKNIPVANFYAYPGYLGGITVSAGDINGDSNAEIITGTMGGTTPHVIVFDLNNLPATAFPTVYQSFYAFDPQYFGIVNLATGDFDGDSVDELVTASGPGAPSTILIFKFNNNPTPEVYRSFLPFGGLDRGGVSPGTGSWNNDGTLNVIAGVQTGPKPLINVFNVKDPVVPKLIDQLFAFNGALEGGVAIG